MRRTLRFSSYDDVLADAEALAASGYARSGNWGLGQVCDHLAATMEMSLDGFPSKMPWVVRVLARWLVLGRIRKHRVFQRRVAAPAYLLPQDTTKDRAGLERLRAAVARLKGHPGEMQPSPLFGQLSPQDWHEVHLWHAEHHLSFLRPKGPATSGS
jgi:hypothetical protein